MNVDGKAVGFAILGVISLGTTIIGNGIGNLTILHNFIN